MLFFVIIQNNHNIAGLFRGCAQFHLAENIIALPKVRKVSVTVGLSPDHISSDACKLALHSTGPKECLNVYLPG